MSVHRASTQGNYVVLAAVFLVGAFFFDAAGAALLSVCTTGAALAGAAFAVSATGEVLPDDAFAFGAAAAFDFTMLPNSSAWAGYSAVGALSFTANTLVSVTRCSWASF